MKSYSPLAVKYKCPDPGVFLVEIQLICSHIRQAYKLFLTRGDYKKFSHWESRDKPLILIKRLGMSVNQTVGKPIYS